LSAPSQPSPSTTVRVGGGATRLELVALALLLVVAFALRTRHLESFQIGPDDGSYLNSALVHELPRTWNPVQWVREDVAWVRHLIAHYGEPTVTYQHSYLHQLTTRYLYRFGLGPLTAVRTSSALTGTLTVFLAWWMFARLWPERRRLGLLAAALVAFAPFHVFYSRTGWGQVGMSAFYLAHGVVLYRVLFVIEDGDRRAFRRAGFALLGLSILAFGWHEGVAPYLAGSAACVGIAPFVVERDARVRPRILSRRTWTYVWSTAPVGAVTLALRLWSPWAQQVWFNEKGLARIDSWSELKRLSLENLVSEQRVHVMLGWGTIVFGVAGFVVLWRARRSLAAHVAAAATAGSVVLFLFFGDAYLARIYMPLWLALIVFSAVALAALVAWLAARVGHAVAGIVLAAALGMQAAVTSVTLFGDVESPLFVQRLYTIRSKGNTDMRDVDAPILDRLRAEYRPGERVTVFSDKGAIFRLMGIGITAREDYFEGEHPAWSDWVVGVRNQFEKRPFFEANGGEYRFVVADTTSRWGLYRRVPR